MQHPGTCIEQCGDKCTIQHSSPCARGKLAEDYLYCPSRVQGNSEITLAYIHFENVNVQNYDKGADYTHIEKVETKLTDAQFDKRFRDEFTDYCEHIVPSWWLR